MANKVSNHSDNNLTKPLHCVTPLYHSKLLSTYTPNHDIYLKIESFQPSKSFKIRGVGLRCQKAVAGGAKHLVAASGGNAGIAVAYSSKLLQVPCTIYLSKITPQEIKDRLKLFGANIKIHGNNYAEASCKAQTDSNKPGMEFIHPYDHEAVWEGNSSIVDEIHDQLPEKPVAIVTTVGGGGLLMGILCKVKKYGWEDIPILVFEPEGSNCFHQSIKANKIVTLDHFESKIVCLGAPSIPQKLFEIHPNFNIISQCITDKQAFEACIRFANDELLLVDPACGAALSAVYSNILSQIKIDGKSLPKGPVVIIVCGGSGTSLSKINEWKNEFNITE